MNELSDKEKAKAYDEVVNKLKVFMAQGVNPLITRADVQDFFPELAESEDEEIGKTLVKFFKDWNKTKSHCWGVPVDKIIAWLEKQGEQKSIWHNEDEEPQRGSLILLIMQSGTPIVAQIIEPNHTFNHGERWAYIDDLLEKQGKNNMGISETTKQELENNLNKALEKETSESWNEFLDKQGEREQMGMMRKFPIPSRSLLKRLNQCLLMRLLNIVRKRVAVIMLAL